MTIYLDYQASTPIDPRVKTEMLDALDGDFANPSSASHSAGWAARKRVEDSRATIARMLGCDATEIIFTSGATEADNIGVLGAALGAPEGRRRILIGSTEHKAVIEPAQAAERYGFTVEYIPVDENGSISLSVLEDCLDSDVAVVSLMLANNEIGTIHPIKRIAEISAKFGAFVHTDATQAPTAVALDMLELGVDAASFSSHKIYGPKGVGALYLSSAAPWCPKPVMFGGGQENGLRPGTLPTHLCVGFAKALSIIVEEGDSERKHLKTVRDLLSSTLEGQISGCRLTASPAQCHPANLHVSFSGVDAGDLLDRLQPHVAAATGSACTSGQANYSHVLRAIGKSFHEAREGLRLSVGRFTTIDQVQEAAERIKSAVDDIRHSSPTEIARRGPVKRMGQARFSVVEQADEP